MASGALSVRQGGGMAPPPPRPAKRKQVVLDEDDWSSKIEAIIERDFFPELSKLQSKVEWLQAIRSGDPEQIRQAQLNIAQRRANSHTPGKPLFTPGGTAARLVHGSTPFFPAATPGLAPISENEPTLGEAAEAHPSGAAPADASLDTFLAAHTSEDNASFGELLEDVNKRRRLRQAAQAVHQNPQLLLMPPDAGREKTDGFGTTGQQTDTLITWPYRPLNTLYYDSSTRDVVPYTERELSNLVQGPPKQILHRNTRFPKPEGPLPGGATPSSSTAPQQGEAAGGAVRPTAPGVGGTVGYDVVATPSFDPGVDGTPFMTWGDIEATPLRIEAEDLPLGPVSESGAKFRVPDMPMKEQRGHALAAKAANSLRRKGKVPGRSSTPLVRSAAANVRLRGATPGSSHGMSDAARRLASSLHKGKRSDADAQLRQSYAQTPGSSRKASVPGSARGGSAWTSAAPTPSRTWTPSATPSVRDTLQEEQLRVEALLKLKEKDMLDKAELSSARKAALASHQQGQQGSGQGGGGASGTEAIGTGAGSLTDGLLAI